MSAWGAGLWAVCQGCQAAQTSIPTELRDKKTTIKGLEVGEGNDLSCTRQQVQLPRAFYFELSPEPHAGRLTLTNTGVSWCTLAVSGSRPHQPLLSIFINSMGAWAHIFHSSYQEGIAISCSSQQSTKKQGDQCTPPLNTPGHLENLNHEMP